MTEQETKRRAARLAAAFLTGCLNTSDIDMWPELDEEERRDVEAGVARIIRRLEREGRPPTRTEL